MINFDFNEHCCGCGSCANSCNVGAITMKPNNEGFLMPHVVETKCVNCGKCDIVCPYLNDTHKNPKGYSITDFEGKRTFLYFSNKEERKDSASGGFVYDLNRQVVEEGGFVSGCIWDENMRAVHVVGNTQEDIKKIQSSKYVQSDLGVCFKTIKTHLKNSDKVVFSGTPCQTAALKQYLGILNDSPLLYSVCIMCHGVPSPKVWEKYKIALERKYDAKMSFCNMRDKSIKGYSKSYVKYKFQNNFGGEKTITVPTYLEDPYIFLFTDDLYLRNSCNHCKYKSIYSGADILVGDFHQSIPSAGNQGCSSVISLTKKGDAIISHLSGEIISVSNDKVLSVNSMAFSSSPRNSQRDKFFSNFVEIPDNHFLTYLNSFLPMRFKMKVVLDKLGLFTVVKKIFAR